MKSLTFETKLRVTRNEVWRWISSVDGISRELWPFLKMTAPSHIRSLDIQRVRLGVPLFRSFILLFGIIPFDYSDLTLLAIRENYEFVEESAMGSMKSWRHIRRILDCGDDSASVILVDELHFEPRLFAPIVAWIVRRLFLHRHEVLRATFNTPSRARFREPPSQAAPAV